MTWFLSHALFFFFFQAKDGIRDLYVTGVQTVLFRSLVDMQKCDPNARASTDNANGTTQASTFATATVDSTRTSNSDPMRARIWIDDPESEGATIKIGRASCRGRE